MAQGIVLVVVDCLRSDHVSAYGYPRPTTPTIDALADGGILWERAFSTSSWTRPSVTSMMTGLYPSAHGVFEGLKRNKDRTTVTTDVLQTPGPTLAEVLSENGWRCGAFINNAQLGEFSRLNRGFASYLPAAGKADRLIGIFLEWLEADMDRPFFAYLHLLEAHWPYKPRRRHVAMFGGDRDTNFFRDYSAREFGELRRSISRGEAVLSDEQLEHMIQMYDGAVRRLDGKIKIILAMLKELGLYDKTAVLVTADHGEEFLDHGRIGHGQSLYDELTHVPLIASVPGERGGVRHEETVSLVDLPRTILSLGEVTGDMPGRNLLQPSCSQSLAFGELRIGRRYQQSVRDDRWKLHRSYKFSPPDGEIPHGRPKQWMEQYPFDVSHELYDTKSDPAEQRNLADDPEHGSVLREMTGHLDAWWPRVNASDTIDDEVEIDATVVKRLHDLGYIE